VTAGTGVGVDVETGLGQTFLGWRNAATHQYYAAQNLAPTTGDYQIYVNTNGGNGWLEAMRVQRSNGNVGIGTTTPGATLDVAGNINFSGTVSYQGTSILQVPGGPGSFSTAVGLAALAINSSGGQNTAFGYASLINNTTGSGNIAVGVAAGVNVSTGSNNIHIGSSGSSDESSTIRIGIPGTQSSFFAAGIYGVNSNGIPVYINSNGQLGTVSSSRRYKEDIQDMGDASNGLLRLRPVTFRYQKPFADGSKPIQYGLIAEEVAEVYPDLVARNADGQIETVKYQVLDSMLLNEVQKQQKEIGSQLEKIHMLEDQNRSLQDRLARLEVAMEKIASSAGSQ
jgi:hypothetical protein